MNASTGTICVQNLHKQFGNNLVLKGISLDILSGERVCIIGPSGSGKSTLLRCLNGLEDATSGKIQINGYDINHDGQNINAMRATVGMVFQRFNLFPHKTVLDNVMSGPLVVKKGSKILSLTDWGIPDPVSLTLMRTNFPAFAMEFLFAAS